MVDVAPVDTERRLADFAVTGFDLNYEYPVRARLFRSVAPDGTLDHVLIVVMHHIVGDGASLGPLITDVLTAYAARLAHEQTAWRPLPVQYADWIGGLLTGDFGILSSSSSMISTSSRPS